MKSGRGTRFSHSRAPKIQLFIKNRRFYKKIAEGGAGRPGPVRCNRPGAIFWSPRGAQGTHRAPFQGPPKRPAGRHFGAAQGSPWVPRGPLAPPKVPLGPLLGGALKGRLHWSSYVDMCIPIKATSAQQTRTITPSQAIQMWIARPGLSVLQKVTGIPQQGRATKWE